MQSIFTALLKFLQTLFSRQGVVDMDKDLVPEVPQVASKKEEVPRFVIQPTDSREIKYLVVHTTGGSYNSTVESIQRWFTGKKENGYLGWSRGGYHWLVTKDAEAHRIYPDDVRTNGTSPWHGVNNSNALHIAFAGPATVGGIKPEQAKTILELVEAYLKAYPDIQVLGHGQVHKRRTCPNFNLPAFLKDNAIPEHRIYPHDHYGNITGQPIPNLV